MTYTSKRALLTAVVSTPLWPGNRWILAEGCLEAGYQRRFFGVGQLGFGVYQAKVSKGHFVFVDILDNLIQINGLVRFTGISCIPTRMTMAMPNLFNPFFIRDSLSGLLTIIGENNGQLWRPPANRSACRQLQCLIYFPLCA